MGVRNPVGGAALSILITLAASMATYYILEKRLIDLGRRLSRGD
jgi:peptidoglycan/LPS O-acetylase OafA/YrhL